MGNRHGLRIINASEGEAVPVQSTAVNMDTRTIFLALLAQEADAGKLTAWRRRRLIRYAAQLGLSPIEIGEFLANRKYELENGATAGLDSTHALHCTQAENGDIGSARTSLGLLWGLGTAALGIGLILLGMYWVLA